jgi:hypothetical protein
MSELPIWNRLLEPILSIGATPAETDSRRSGRRVFMLAFVLSTLLTIPGIVQRFDAGYEWVGVSDLVTTAIPVLLLGVIVIWPSSYAPAVHAILLFAFAGAVIDRRCSVGCCPQA